MGKRAVWMTVVLMGLLCLPAFSGPPPESLDTGAEMINIYSGDMAPALFPHRMHQDALEDCSVCHAMFAMKSGSIRLLKDGGTLKTQQVMNEKCLACHKQLKAVGKSAGPTVCSQCHVRNSR